MARKINSKSPLYRLNTSIEQRQEERNWNSSVEALQLSIAVITKHPYQNVKHASEMGHEMFPDAVFENGAIKFKPED